MTSSSILFHNLLVLKQYFFYKSYLVYSEARFHNFCSVQSLPKWRLIFGSGHQLQAIPVLLHDDRRLATPGAPEPPFIPLLSQHMHVKKVFGEVEIRPQRLDLRQQDVAALVLGRVKPFRVLFLEMISILTSVLVIDQTRNYFQLTDCRESPGNSTPKKV